MPHRPPSRSRLPVLRHAITAPRGGLIPAAVTRLVILINSTLILIAIHADTDAQGSSHLLGVHDLERELLRRDLDLDQRARVPVRLPHLHERVLHRVLNTGVVREQRRGRLPQLRGVELCGRAHHVPAGPAPAAYSPWPYAYPLLLAEDGHRYWEGRVGVVGAWEGRL